MEREISGARNHPLIAFKDAKGVIDCRATVCAIFGTFVRSMGVVPLYRENSGSPLQPLRPERSDRPAFGGNSLPLTM